MTSSSRYDNYGILEGEEIRIVVNKYNGTEAINCCIPHVIFQADPGIDNLGKVYEKKGGGLIFKGTIPADKAIEFINQAKRENRGRGTVLRSRGVTLLWNWEKNGTENKLGRKKK